MSPLGAKIGSYIFSRVVENTWKMIQEGDMTDVKWTIKAREFTGDWILDGFTASGAWQYDRHASLNAVH